MLTGECILIHFFLACLSRFACVKTLFGIDEAERHVVTGFLKEHQFRD